MLESFPVGGPLFGETLIKVASHVPTETSSLADPEPLVPSTLDGRLRAALSYRAGRRAWIWGGACLALVIILGFGEPSRADLERTGFIAAPELGSLP